MKTIVLASILLHFAGLNVVTNSIPNDCGIKIIVPRVHYTSPNPNERTGAGSRAPVPTSATARTAPKPAQPPSPEPGRIKGSVLDETPHVQDHVSLLVFRTDSLASAVNWPKTDLTTGANAGYSYVVLDGDYLRLVTTGGANVAASLDNLVLPHLTSCCSATSSLRPEYLPPYSGAAAVFDIGEGTLTSCRAWTRDGQGRLDTELELTTTGALFVISASTMKTTKELRFTVRANENLEIVAANVPVTYLTGHDTIYGLPHSHAYYAMGAGAIASCNTSLQDWLKGHQSQFASTPDCHVTAFAPIAGKNMKVRDAPRGILPSVQISNFECSNTQWP